MLHTYISICIYIYVYMYVIKREKYIHIYVHICIYVRETKVYYSRVLYRGDRGTHLFFFPSE